MKLNKKVELLNNSSKRMREALPEKRDAFWWSFMWREIWIHLKRTLELAWMIVRKRDNDKEI